MFELQYICTNQIINIVDISFDNQFILHLRSSYEFDYFQINFDFFFKQDFRLKYVSFKTQAQ